MRVASPALRYAEQFEEVVHAVIDGDASSDLTFELYEAFEADASVFSSTRRLGSDLEGSFLIYLFFSSAHPSLFGSTERSLVARLQRSVIVSEFGSLLCCHAALPATSL